MVSFAIPIVPSARLAAGAPITSEALLPYRLVGDPLADGTIEAIFSTGPTGLEKVHRLLRHLIENDHPFGDDREHDERSLPGEVVEKVRAYFRESDDGLQALDARRIAEGERIFRDHGPEILMLLGTYSLPASYTARRGAQVLAATGRLESQPVRRLIETTQMVIDVMSSGGLSVGKGGLIHGKGVRSAQKVRLMHAAIRRLIVERDGQAWVDQFGIPINQMDLCGTLMTFSSVILDGLAMLKVKLTDDEKEAYLYAWRSVGTIMGISDELIPHDVERAAVLTQVIRETEIGESEEGIALTAALVQALQGYVKPRLLRGLPVALMRRFLGPYAKVIRVPRAGWTSFLVTIFIGFSAAVDFVLRRVGLLRWLHRKFSNVIIGVFLVMERGGNRPDFSIPDHLADGWGMARK